MNNRNSVLISVVAFSYELPELRETLPSLCAPEVRLDLVDISPEMEETFAGDNVKSVVDKLRCIYPDILVIGQTALAEEILARLRLAHSPLVVRYSRYFANDTPVYTDKTPTQAGYHLDIPKSTQDPGKLLGNRSLIQSVSVRDSVGLKRSLPQEARYFPGFENWKHSATPPPEFPIVDFTCLDEEGIDLLFSQTGSGHIKQVVKTKTNDHGARLGFELIAGKVLEMFGIGSAKVTGDKDLRRSYSEEATEAFTAVDKLRVVIDALQDSGQLVSIREDRKANIPNNTKVFVDLYGWFDVEKVNAALKDNQDYAEFKKHTISNNNGRIIH